MNKKNGFTLIELLAVIVILAVIALIVTPMVMNTINSAREGAAKSSGYEYIHAIETQLAVKALSSVDYSNATFQISNGVISKIDFSTVVNNATVATTGDVAVWSSLANHTNNINGLVVVNGLSVINGSLSITNGTVYKFTYDGKTLTTAK